MNLADEVLTALRSTRTVFVCNGGGTTGHCGGALWHIDGDDEGRLTCERCNSYMLLGTTTTVPFAGTAASYQASFDYDTR